VTDALGRLWAGWRSGYVAGLAADAAPVAPPGATSDEDRTLFERLVDLADAEGDEAALVVHRGAAAMVLLNAYPYAAGHCLVVPHRRAVHLEDLHAGELAELWELVGETVATVRRAYQCSGVNVGANLGAAAGAGVPDHLHVHVVPRWAGDTNFMTATAGVRVLPEPLPETWAKLRQAWPGTTPA
jgi:ATP adenylyltransferase